MLLPEEKIKEILLRYQLVDESTLTEVEKEAKRLNMPVSEILFGRRLLDKGYFTNILAQELGVARVALRKFDIPLSVLQLVPEKIALEKQVIPFEADEQALKLAMVNPRDLETISLISSITNLRVEPYLALPEEIQYALTNYQKIYKEKYQKLIEQEISRLGGSVDEEELTATRIIDNLLGYAMGMNASDIHLEVMENYGLVRFRIDGVLREIMRLPKKFHPALIAKIKVLANLQLDEHFRPQDGRIKTKLGEFSFDIRVAIMPTLYGEKTVLRLLAANLKPTSIDELGVNKKIKSIIERAIGKTYGMLLITGPTGSGKTTTLYTILEILNRPEVNICTIEDPIEYELAYVNQTQINPKVSLTFATGLRSFLRQDPDIVMVGEIRDLETAEIAVQAALTGHLLLATLHTNDAPSSIARLLDLGVPSYLIAATLNIILAQRLARKICLDCIYSEPITSIQKEIIIQELQTIGLSGKEISNTKLPEYIFKGKGCQLCGLTGYRGRIGIFEGVEADEEVRNFLTKGSFNLPSFREFIRKEKDFIAMFEDGLEKITLGITTLEEVLRVIRE